MLIWECFFFTTLVGLLSFLFYVLSVPFGDLIGFYAFRFAVVFVVFVSFTFIFLIFSLVCQADVRLVELERKVRALEQEKTLETTEGTLVNLRRYLNRPNSAFDRFEVLDILQALVRLARTQAHQKAEEYAAALDEVRARWDSLSSPELQRLLLGLLGDPVRAKVAKEAASILKSASKTSGQSHVGPIRPRLGIPFGRGPYFKCGRLRAPVGPLRRSTDGGRGALSYGGRANTRGYTRLMFDLQDFVDLYFPFCFIFRC